MSERFVANSCGRVPPRSGWRVPPVPLLPGAVASSTRRPAADHQACAGESLLQVIDSIDRDRAGKRLAFFLAALHQSTAARAEAAVGKLTGTQCRRPRPNTLPDRFGSWVRPDVTRWCEWATPRWPVPPKPLTASVCALPQTRVWPG